MRVFQGALMRRAKQSSCSTDTASYVAPSLQGGLCASRRALRAACAAVAISACGTDPVSLTRASVSGAATDVATHLASWTAINLGIDPNFVETVPQAINNRYQILGYSVGPLGSRQFIHRVGQARRYFGAGFSANALNDQGVLAGSYNGAPAYWDSEQHVSFIPGVPTGALIDISETGWMIGQGNVGAGVRHFVWRPGWAQVRVLGAGSPVTATAVSVNNAGFVAGEISGQGGVWSPAGVFEPIPLPDTVISVQPAEINDAGKVAGIASVFNPFGVSSGFSWTRGQPMTVMVPNHLGLYYFVSDIDRHGRVYGTINDDSFFYPGVWNPGLQALPGPSGASEPRLADVNDCGVAVGWDQGPHWYPLPRTPILWLTEC